MEWTDERLDKLAELVAQSTQDIQNTGRIVRQLAMIVEQDHDQLQRISQLIQIHEQRIDRTEGRNPQ